MALNIQRHAPAGGPMTLNIARSLQGEDLEGQVVP
jgi:hypothetical protein